MTGREVYGLMKKARRELSDVVSARIRFDPEMIPGDGRTRYEPDEPLSFRIGVAGLKNSDTDLLDYEAMLPIVALFHEVCGHGGQILREFDKNTDLSRILAMNYFACKGSSEYYDGYAGPHEFTPQYKSQPFEIAAQYAGIRSARTFLSREIGQEKADAMLKAYVDERIRTGFEFIDGDPRDVDEALKSFDKAFAAAADKHRAYSPDTPDKLDSFHVCIPKIGAGKVLNAINCRSGSKQDFMAAAMYRSAGFRNSDLFERPVFDGIDMSLDNAFSMFPKWPKPAVRKSSLGQMEDLAAQTGKEETGMADQSDLEKRLYTYDGGSLVQQDGRSVLIKGDILFREDHESGGFIFTSSRGAIVCASPGQDPSELGIAPCPRGSLPGFLDRLQTQSRFQDAEEYRYDSESGREGAFYTKPDGGTISVERDAIGYAVVDGYHASFDGSIESSAASFNAYDRPIHTISEKARDRLEERDDGSPSVLLRIARAVRDKAESLAGNAPDLSPVEALAEYRIESVTGMKVEQILYGPAPATGGHKSYPDHGLGGRMQVPIGPGRAAGAYERMLARQAADQNGGDAHVKDMDGPDF